jgi:tellurite resistance protein TerC
MFEIENSLAFLNAQIVGQSVGLWLGFFGLISALLVLDLGILNRKDRVIEPKESLIYTAVYVMLACVFGVWLWGHLGQEHGVDYFTAYFIELSLSLDNLFVMSLILGYFSIPRKYQHRILFWGIVGVLVMRGVMIGSGLIIVQHFHGVLYLFAAFLIFTGLKMLRPGDDDDNLDDSGLIKFFQKHLRFTKEINGHQFLVTLPHHQTGRMVKYATPLLMALISIEFMDLIFALDSVPAVFAITTEPFVVYSSNIFAILGLRSMYFAVVAVLDRFKYMSYALAIVLVFIGAKVFYNGFIGPIDPVVSMGITLGLLLGGALVSIFCTKSGAAND